MAEGELRDDPGEPDWDDDIASLYTLQDSLIQMPTMLPSERRERELIYRESGRLTREALILTMLEVDAGWAPWA